MCGEENTSRPANPPSKKEYFLTATTPQALARGVSAQLIQKPRRVSPPQRRKKVKSFSSATCAAKKIPLGLQTCAPSAFGGRRVRCSRPQTLSSKKYYFFDKDNPAGRSLRGCLSMTDAASAAVSISSLGRRRAAPSSDHSDSSAFFSADSFLIFGMPQMNAGSTTTISA